MYAAVANVTINDEEAATSALHSQVVPQTKSAPGFVAGYWVQFEGNRGTAVVVFETEEGARAATQMQPPGGFVTFDSIEVGEVVANA